MTLSFLGFRREYFIRQNGQGRPSYKTVRFLNWSNINKINKKNAIWISGVKHISRSLKLYPDSTFKHVQRIVMIQKFRIACQRCWKRKGINFSSLKKIRQRYNKRDYMLIFPFIPVETGPSDRNLVSAELLYSQADLVLNHWVGPCGHRARGV